MKGKVITNCTWMKPDEDVLKLNSDGSVTNDNTRFGGMLRDSNGEVKLAYTASNGSRSVLFQELQDIESASTATLELPQYYYGDKGAKHKVSTYNIQPRL
ncbi:hypothetical protein IFM89_037775 [Coptis chinensis]|uniref:RNase H type-1 domain-containing protein n=1 Tax=Coptis chinensis TaxID=261450 RepID=A0A835HB07_9MAGN|nr:hypothetical protein IFM89_037775 [Coptis chinensis]